MVREVRFYKTASGRCPVREFLDSLNGRQAQKVTWVLSLIEDLGTVPAKYFKKLVNTDGIWEVRVNVGRDTFRFLVFFDGPTVLVLASGFSKKSRKTPKKLIVLAEQRKSDYLQRRKP
jgi:phage-related protein